MVAALISDDLWNLVAPFLAAGEFQAKRRTPTNARQDCQQVRWP